MEKPKNKKKGNGKKEVPEKKWNPLDQRKRKIKGGKRRKRKP